MKFILILKIILIAVTQITFAQTWNKAIKITLGEEEKVFIYTEDRCDVLDLPDVYAHPIRTPDGIMLVSGNAPDNYFMFGEDFNSLKRSCEPVFVSGDKWSADAFRHQEWITSVYSEDGITIHALVHNEYHDPFAENCKPGVTDPSNPCWYNFISYAKSTDGGRTFVQPESPNHLVAMIPFKWNANAVERGAPPPHGYFEPSNIVKHNGHYYSLMFAILSNTNAGIRGTCIMRTDDISNPGSWRIWDGSDFNIPLVNPYTNPPADSSKFLPEFISHRTIRDLRGSLTWNTYLNQFILVGAGVHKVDGIETCGFFLSRSDDLINWTQPQLIRETILGWQHCNRQTPDQAARNIVQEAYPSLIDHDAPDISFAYSDSTAYLYFMQNMDNWKQGGWGLRRDLVRIPITIQKIEPISVTEEYFNNFQFKVTPNPARDYIEIIQPSEGSVVKIYNTLGEIVMELPDVAHLGDVAHFKRIDISYLPAGLYFIKFGNYSQIFMVIR
ncbi:MAG: T9SS type A sorting domain-containing protein [Candidatus Kapabacteria bacterium]|nr:T9SS type A sorting domain-containing protein [Ignavibacteriota bacterium]MCW5883637.1 T9SS type A sorting domain-containing protein [Candidatus Kapabacteria bacterium]